MSTRVVSPVMGGILGAVLVASCTIHLGPTGGSGSGQPETTGAGGNMSGGEGAGGLSPEEHAAIDALQHVDPQEAALKSAAAAYAAVACASLVESQVQDPAAVDPATVDQLFAEYAPVAANEAVAWMTSVDPSILPMSDIPNNKCNDEPYGCNFTEHCAIGDGAVCAVTQCGKGACPWCPDTFSNLIYKSYCAYSCMQGSKNWGFGLNFRTRFPPPKDWSGFFCFPFPK